MADQAVFGSQEPLQERNQWRAMYRGFAGKCPNCGDGALFNGYVKAVDNCDNCNEDISHQRADDFPAYLTIFIIGHTLIPLFLGAYFWIDLNVWTQLAIFLPLTIVGSLWLLPRVKGAVIGLQWALRMHGFGGQEDDIVEFHHPEQD